MLMSIPIFYNNKCPVILYQFALLKLINFHDSKTTENSGENHNVINLYNHELLMMNIDCKARTQ